MHNLILSLLHSVLSCFEILPEIKSQLFAILSADFFFSYRSNCCSLKLLLFFYILAIKRCRYLNFQVDYMNLLWSVPLFCTFFSCCRRSVRGSKGLWYKSAGNSHKTILNFFFRFLFYLPSFDRHRFFLVYDINKRHFYACTLAWP